MDNEEKDPIEGEEVDEIEELPELEEGEDDTTDYKALALKNAGIAKRFKTKFEKTKEIKPVVPPVIEKPKPQENNDINTAVNEALEKRDLESLEVSDDLKKEIQTYATVNKVSIRKAQDSKYIQFLKAEEAQNTKLENASLSKGRKGTTKKDYNETKATDFDLTTPEGKAGFKEYKEWLKNQ